MAKNKYMQELSAQELVEELNFLIPEIQRDYVWGFNEREILDTFCEDIKFVRNLIPGQEDLKSKIKELSDLGKYDEIKQLLEQNRDTNSLNIGFLYSYQPNYRLEHFPESDFYKDVYLIDGQQRFTTLFLLLFYNALKEGNDKLEEFYSLFRFNDKQETLAFDYRVRKLTHNFFIELIKNVKNITELLNFKNSTWFLKDFENDPTINSVIDAFKIIHKHFDNETELYFDFIKEQIKFWHFKTEKTDQGEELYITMNSRGKQLEDNETLRAKLFEDINESEALKWSEKWEEWQDFFWKNRNKEYTSSADDGFNEFLKCIAGLEAYNTEAKDFINVNDPIYPKRILKYLSLEKIEKHFNSLSFIFSNVDKFKGQFKYSNWVDRSVELIKEILFNNSTNWFIDYNDSLRARERMNMVFLWSILRYLNEIKKTNEDIDNIYRLMRVYWIRYNNHDRAVSSINARISEILNNGIWSNSVSDDEKEKHTYFEEHKNDDDFRDFECSLWRLEDHPLNINGYQVGNQNITHLIKFDNKISPQYIEDIYDRFCKLFDPKKPVGSKLLNTILLFYGFYAMKRSPYYYDNWDFSSWRRIIRDLDSDEDVFKNFFKEFSGNNLKELLSSKKKEFILKNKDIIKNSNSLIETNNLLETLQYYLIIIDENIWEKGRYIADTADEIDNCFCSYEKDGIIYNTKGDFRGYYGNIPLIDIVHKETDVPIEKIKDILNELEINANA